MQLNKFSLFAWGKPEQIQKRERELPGNIDNALSTIKQLSRDYSLLLAAVQAAVSTQDHSLKAFIEDYGMDSIDPIQRIDILKYALRLVTRAQPI